MNHARVEVVENKWKRRVCYRVEERWQDSDGSETMAARRGSGAKKHHINKEIGEVKCKRSSTVSG